MAIKNTKNVNLVYEMSIHNRGHVKLQYKQGRAYN